MAVEHHVSVVMAARNAQAVIHEQVNALLSQIGPTAELIVVDDASQDATASVVLTLSSPYIRLIKLDRQVGTAAAKNCGVAAAVGDVILFCDADDIVDQRWIANLSQVVQGRAIFASESSFLRLNTDDQRAWYGRHRGMYGTRKCGGRFDYATGAGMGVTRALFDELEGFDERFAQAHDDVDFCYRGQRAGARIVTASGAVVHRRLRQTAGQMMRQQYLYAQSHRAFVAKHALGSTGVLHDAWLRTLLTLPASLATKATRRRWLRTASWTLGLTRGVA